MTLSYFFRSVSTALFFFFFFFFFWFFFFQLYTLFFQLTEAETLTTYAQFPYCLIKIHLVPFILALSAWFTFEMIFWRFLQTPFYS